MTSPEAKILEDTLHRVLSAKCSPHVVREAEGTWAGPLWDRLAEIGVPWLGIPEHRGGCGGTTADAALAVRITARYATPLPIAETALLAGSALAAAGLDVPPDVPLAFVPEPVEVANRGGRNELRGTAEIVAWAGECPYVVVSSGDVVALVATADCTIRPGANIAGERRDLVTFDGAVPRLVGTAPASASTGMARGAAIRAVAICGGAERILELTAEHARTRSQFGKPIGSFQAVSQLLARIAGAVVAAQSAARLAVQALETDDTALAGAAKIVASEVAGTVAGLAHQVHGAIGMTREHELHLHTRRLWAWRDEYGSERYWGRRCGEPLVRSAADPWHDLVGA